MGRDTLNWDIKEKVKLIASSIEQNDNNSGFSYFEDLIPFHFKDDPDLPIIQQKMDNLMKILNTEGGFERIKNMDFEDEIWYIV